MRLFSGLENSLEKYIEGFFKDKFGSDARAQPTDIAKKLARAMRDKRRVSISNVYVPNEYTVLLHPEDHKTIKPMAPLLADELADYLVQKAAEKKFTLVNRPRIDFIEGEGVEPGDILIESNFGAVEPDQGQPMVRRDQPDFAQDNQDTRDYRPLTDTAPIPNLQQRCSATLLVEEGNDAGKEFPLTDYRTSLGRRDTCDIVLSDTSVSRRHAQFEKIGGRFWLTDLNSTNGIYVNGLPVDKVELTTGDVIMVGNTVLIFKEF
ncbi:MAG: DUF3662 domain-containing protein [Firmicutes bacterium]|nr:DUF3662 domain-containing protein [Bacillota bacterium]